MIATLKVRRSCKRPFRCASFSPTKTVSLAWRSTRHPPACAITSSNVLWQKIGESFVQGSVKKIKNFTWEIIKLGDEFSCDVTSFFSAATETLSDAFVTTKKAENECRLDPLRQAWPSDVGSREAICVAGSLAWRRSSFLKLHCKPRFLRSFSFALCPLQK